MKIEKFRIKGFKNTDTEFTHDIPEDIGIITGRNGAGKTSILKLLWYVISGNILYALQEVNFAELEIFTSDYRILITKISQNYCKIELELGGHIYDLEDDEHDEDYFNPELESAEDKAASLIAEYGVSVFFPTFRRIEGGFTLASGHSRRNSLDLARRTRARGDIEEALQGLSTRLSKPRHKFISSISTQDISSLLLSRYAEFSEKSNSLQADVSKEIIAEINQFDTSKSSKTDSKDAELLLEEIRERIVSMEDSKKKVFASLVAVENIADKLFSHAGIEFSNRFSFGDAANAINSNQLSAGEKQMLSFICYNAFFKDAIFFIDEPELSLHVDWQRQLFSILRSQQTSNQFIIATHSPFIYTKFPDKEVLIDKLRGDEQDS